MYLKNDSILNKSNWISSISNKLEFSKQASVASKETGWLQPQGNSNLLQLQQPFSVNHMLPVAHFSEMKGKMKNLDEARRETKRSQSPHIFHLYRFDTQIYIQALSIRG